MKIYNLYNFNHNYNISSLQGDVKKDGTRITTTVTSYLVQRKNAQVVLENA